VRSVRFYRVVQLVDESKAWLVQGDTRTHDEWVDVARFHERDDAHRYIQQVCARQRALEDGRRRRAEARTR